MNKDNNTNFWISYADLMAGLLFVFILLIGAIIVKYSLLESESTILEKNLQDKSSALEKNRDKLAKREQEITDLFKDIEEKELTLSSITDKLKYNKELLKAALTQNKKLQEALTTNLNKLNKQTELLYKKETLINEFIEKIKNNKQIITAKNSENETLSTALLATKDTLKNKEEKLKKLLDELLVKKNIIQNLEASNKEFDKKISNLTTSNKQQELNLIKKDDLIQSYLNQLDLKSKETVDLKEVIELKDKELSKILDQILLKENLIKSFKEKNIKLDNEILTLKEKVQTSQEEKKIFIKDLQTTKLKIKNLTGLKIKVITILKDSLGKEIQIDPKNGAIRLSSNILFDEGKHLLKDNAKQSLKNQLFKYLNTILENKEINQHIDKIIIEGHTNSKGSFFYNLNLSQQRAYSVMQFLLSLNFKEKEKLQQLLVASGRSYLDPIFNKNNIEDKEASRRIEVKFSLKNEEAIKEIETILDEK